MDLAPGTWLKAPDGTLIYLWRTHGSDEPFADHRDKIDSTIATDDPEYALRLTMEWPDDPHPLDWRLRPTGEVTPDGYEQMIIVPPPGVYY